VRHPTHQPALSRQFLVMEDLDLDVGSQTDTTTTSKVILTPGAQVQAPEGFLRGHGTYTVDDGLVASVAGVVERVNKLTTVRAVKSRFAGSAGDVVVGRITEVRVVFAPIDLTGPTNARAQVGNKRWKVDINSKQDGILLLGAINLPGGAQRRRTLEDQLQMRALFAENDVISAEVSSIYKDGGVALQTRSLKYGKLENGRLLKVPSTLVKRLKHHFCTLSCGVDVVLGINGYVWVTAGKTREVVEEEDEAERNRLTAEMEMELKRHALRVIGKEDRLRVARVCNSIAVLAHFMRPITIKAIEHVFNASAALPADELLLPANAGRLLLKSKT
jgi:exosome complex component RRP4